MKPEHRIYSAVAGGYVLMACIVIGMSLVAVPVELRTCLFWPRVLWTLFLVGVVWTCGGSYFTASVERKKGQRGPGGIAPSLLIVIGTYALLSFVVMLLHAVAPPGGMSSRVHLFFQIGLAGACAFFYVVFNVARGHAVMGVETSFAGIASPADLCDLLAAEEGRLSMRSDGESWAKCVKSLRALREVIRYSLPQTTVLADDPIYRKLVDGVEASCQALRACAQGDGSALIGCIFAIESLKIEAKTLSAKAIRR